MFSDCIIHALYILLKSSSFFNLVYWWLLRFLNEGMELGKSVVGSGRERYPVLNSFSSQISTLMCFVNGFPIARSICQED